MFVEQFDQKNSWCSKCNSDTACRIPGWPVMNATSLCQSTPNQLLFGEEGCCIHGTEPFELAEWTGIFCNGSEWRQEFDICGGMACRDWEEWIMPWNWTVQNNTLPPDQQKCTTPSRYLAIYAGEHFFWLLATFGIGWIRLRIAQREEAKNRSILRYLLLYAWPGLVFKQSKEKVLKEKLLPEGEHLRPAITDRLRWGFPVIMGVVLAGIQLGFNFTAAHFIKSAPGYEDAPLTLLALLFCCRPRLSWLSCLLALISKKRLIKIFGFEPDGDGLWAAKLVLSSVAVTSAVTEAIMQLLGAYFLGSAAHVGEQRGFYVVHHLRPKMGGRDARHMYLGALFWVMLCIPLVVVWFFVALFFSQVYDAVAGWRRGIFHFLKPKSRKIPDLAKAPVTWLLDYINPDETSRSSSSSSQSNMHHHHILNETEQPFLVASNDPFNQPIAYQGPGSGDLFDEQPMAIAGRQSSRRSRYSHMSQYEQQPFAIPDMASGSRRPASLGYSHDGSAIQRRTPGGAQYNELSQSDELDEIQIDEQPLAVSSTSPPQRQVAIPSRRNASNASLLAPPTQDAPPLSSSNSSSNKRSDYTTVVNLKWQSWESKIIFAGAFLGMLAYASQWVFWDGFVKASGDRFCPPSVWKVSGIWWGGSFVYVGAPFMAY
ncbi:uncharacterized protein K460DRAFT_357311 [Cucurbitaria berberidis CBS 394.84]|uniref:Uncharacterized protein n=1 Tax=Cucurbitaria berberidis CBS 394.84 TaxID=1168544 RepID=A0A9P4L6A7_9PLEO|nr:uncharacterized protein K460DRAFT_357311 [Cucurbitaria berberidis CBS 394.84]KAF1843605.1 hypothetical protein K460DRAFT_357311 [Cucurbitaria berberidis CBS 394.84]